MRALLKSLEVDGAKQIQLLTSIDSSGAGTRIFGVGFFTRARDPVFLDNKLTFNGPYLVRARERV